MGIFLKIHINMPIGRITEPIDADFFSKLRLSLYRIVSTKDEERYRRTEPFYQWNGTALKCSLFFQKDH